MLSTSMLSLFVVFAAPAPSPSTWEKCLGKDPAGKISSMVNIDGEQAMRLVDYAVKSNNGIVMRPIGDGAPRRRLQGSRPKPQSIKFKTCNEIDMQIGAPEDCGSLVMLFKPAQAKPLPTDRTERQKWVNRIAQRQKEWDDAHADKTVIWKGNEAKIYDEKCLAKCKPLASCLAGVRTADGFVRPTAKMRPFTGDLDLFDLADDAGRPIVTGDQNKARLMDALVADDALDVLHGAHMDWDASRIDDPQDLAKLENIRQPILDVHRERPIGSPKREPLVVLMPDCTVCKAWAPPHQDDPHASGAGEFAYKCITGEPDLKSPKDDTWPPKPGTPIKLHLMEGQQYYARPKPSSPDSECYAITITKAVAHKDGKTGSYELKNAYGGVSGDDAAFLERRICAGPPPSLQKPRMSVGTRLRIKPGPASPPSDCFDITITATNLYSDGTAGYEYKNAGGGVSGDDADNLEARTCK
jgi:hypothetical protein